MKTVQIWDLATQPSDPIAKNLVLWSAYSDLPKVTSIPRIIDENELSLKVKFLSWTYEISQLTKNKISLLSALDRSDSMNFWWITNFSEKCNFSKSPEMDNVIKILAFEIFFKNSPYKKIELISDNKYLGLAFNHWCNERQINFKHVKKKRFSSLKSYLPNQLKAIVWLCQHLIKRRALFGINLSEWKSSARKISFFSYLYLIKYQVL